MNVKDFFEKIMGSYSEREIKRVRPIVNQVLALESSMQNSSDKELKGMTDKFRRRLDDGEALEDILPEAFAVCREAAWRVLGLKHFDVQIMGGIILHQGRIAEMKTGEGKTLVATLPAYLNALKGQGVHVVTANDYLAKRDSEWMGKVYKFLNLSVGLIVHDIDDIERRQAYNADITYVTNNELGFDYLRDNMAIYKEKRVQRGHFFAIVDEADNILIDEARTPLIISGLGDKSTELYEKANIFAKELVCIVVAQGDDKLDYDEIHQKADYIVDEKSKTATLTANGVAKVEKAFGINNLTDVENMTIAHHVNQAIKAHGTMKRDKDYVIKDGQIIIVDDFTGRMMYGRRYSDGLHQAIEAKEGVKVEHESKTLASITFQNYFRIYSKLAGMTGTALTEEEEFKEIYKLDVVSIPTNKPLMRVDLPDAIYKNSDGKFKALIKDVEERHAKGQPILIGTVSIEKSEKLSSMLKKSGIKHQVLNAKFHEKEAEIIAQAGKKGAVTIATNMAGRGTDIILGGNAEFMAKREMERLKYSANLIAESTGFSESDASDILNARAKFKELYEKFKKELDAEQREVLEVGGLYIIGTERHESRRIDNQLRGRAGRQGDVGMSKFFLSTDDDLMRLFASERMLAMMEKMGLDDDEAIESRMVSRAIEGAQKRVEGRNFDIRKHVIQYDDVNNQQREIIYKQRNQVLEGQSVRDSIVSMIRSVAERLVINYAQSEEHQENWDLRGLHEYIETVFMKSNAWDFIVAQEGYADIESLVNVVTKVAIVQYEAKEQAFGEIFREIERMILLQVVDEKWMSHIDDMEQLRQGITLRAYAQRDPIVEYKFEGMNMFDAMVDSIKEDTLRLLFHVIPQSEIKRRSVVESSFEGFIDKQKINKKLTVREGKIGRNALCPCGSGEKYKRCCGANGLGVESGAKSG